MSLVAPHLPPWRTDLLANSGLNSVGHAYETTLVGGFITWLYTDVIHPRSTADDHAKPSSAFNHFISVRRIHSRFGITMVTAKSVKSELRGMMKAHADAFGYASLLPQRKEPIGGLLFRRIRNTAPGTKIGSRVLDWCHPFFASIAAAFALASEAGFRKDELVHPNPDDTKPLSDRHQLRSNVSWRIAGVIHSDPDAALLASMLPGRDGAVVIPTASKSDPFGLHFSPHPIHLQFNPSDVGNAASHLRRIELDFPCRGPARRTKPLFFSDESFSPLRASSIDTHLSHFLQLHLTPAEAACRSFHSFRIGFACSLLAAGCPYPMIQALCRWRSAESVAIYARLNHDERAGWISKALLHPSTSISTRNLPILDVQDAFLALAPSLRADTDVEAPDL